ncbi:hypothetical protein PISMIDRAFT_685526 [Pisolithus microcarpus 441]|uniref:Uncharacterized protein n=1 Tax=Pisolithus microcarpus 441 TaxID=765257 RepID=A0A0C9YT02_9AGAM|nr:hypothetical protein PISMIDRAFT_685526 [Pisolithus microcarpus 441]
MASIRSSSGGEPGNTRSPNNGTSKRYSTVGPGDTGNESHRGVRPSRRRHTARQLSSLYQCMALISHPCRSPHGRPRCTAPSSLVGGIERGWPTLRARAY